MTKFNTFFMAGFECADHINRSGERINLLKETQHDIRVEEDYQALKDINIKTVREGICWSEVEKSPGVYDFSEVLKRIRAAEKWGIQQLWDLIHFGYPDGLFPTHPQFCNRFEKLCEAFALFYKAHAVQPLFVIPINEISFLAWHSGDVRGTVPFAINSGWDMKYHLCKAAIIGIKKLKNIDSECTVILVEPLVKIHPTEQEYHVLDMNEHQFQAMDIIAGRMCPELGGSEEFLEILGFNYYWDCQWEAGSKPLEWPEEVGNEKRTPLSDLLYKAYKRYEKPIFISETGHFGTTRALWMDEITHECIKAQKNGVDLYGICIYPATDRPDWDNLSSYCDCGIWDLDQHKNRKAYQPYIDSLLNAQELLKKQYGFLNRVADFFK
ncbi:hypothetical protein [Flavobacterium foetidum]|uniref:hypothetical protein n=1 Tax=Flavobacterium foetidum TaxID=2026681 RepID=UPI001074E5AB|nr:hypothetical protein [Flavobacterium foetidum]KAF2514879.1 hypothetical protein E0W73_10620 [Flavobacterium foetidum]